MNILIVIVYSEIQCLLCINDVYLLMIKKKGEYNKSKMKKISI